MRGGRFTVMGFTEAELGLVLAAVFAAVGVSAVYEPPAPKPPDNTKFLTVMKERDSIAAAFDRFRDSVRSTKMPQCWEKGEPRAAIAQVRVLGRDRYGLNGQTVTFSQIRSRFAAQIARGDSLGCHYLVRAQLTRGADAIAQSTAVWRLRTLFDVDDRPR
jgi:hypothetical protein